MTVGGLSREHVIMSYLIDEHVDHLRALGRSPRTIEDREDVLRRLHAALPLGLAYATVRQIEQWLAGFQRAERSQWTLVGYDKHVRGFYRWADGRHLEGDPTALIPTPRRPGDRPNPVTDEELRLALERCSDWWRVAILLGALAGLRASEMAQLRCEDVTPEWIRIRRAKGGDPATVPTHPQLRELVSTCPQGWMLPAAAGGGPVNGRSLPPKARNYFDSIGLPTVHLHRFRHYFATNLLRRGVDIRVVQEVMRHQSVRSTQAYTQVVDAQKTAAVALLPALTP